MDPTPSQLLQRVRPSSSEGTDSDRTKLNFFFFVLFVLVDSIHFKTMGDSMQRIQEVAAECLYNTDALSMLVLTF